MSQKRGGGDPGEARPLPKGAGRDGRARQPPRVGKQHGEDLMKGGRISLRFGSERAYGGTAKCGECDDRCGKAAEGGVPRRKRVPEK